MPTLEVALFVTPANVPAKSESTSVEAKSPVAHAEAEG